MENSSSKSTWTPECLQLENQEYELSEELKHNTSEDLERDASILKRIGLTYQRRGELLKDASCFVKASALYNSALIRSENTNTTADLNCLKTENERMFLDVIGGIKDGNLSCYFMKKQREELSVYRQNVCHKLKRHWNEWNETYNIDATQDKRMQEEKKIIAQVSKISCEISEYMKKIARDILQECFNILGKPPQNYAILGLGSLARNEMTPYSDLEAAILIEDDFRDKQFFRNLANLFHLFVLNFGETPLPALAIKSLNDFDKVGGSWFFDSITCNGFCMDGAMPWACKTPIGRPDRERKQGVELIQTPENMSKFQQKDIAQKEGYHLADILCTYTLIDGSKTLLDQYERCLNNEEYVTDRKQRAINALSDDTEKYQKKMAFLIDAKDDSTLINVKQEIFRFPSLISNGFRMIHNLHNLTPWFVLQEMEDKHLISADGSHNIQMAVSIAVLLRLMTCLNNKGQINALSFLSSFKMTTGAKDKSNQDVFFSSENIQWIMRYYFTVLPLVKYLSNKEMDHGERHNTEFYDHENETKGRIYYKCAQFQHAVTSFQDHLRELGYNDQQDPDMKPIHSEDIDVALNILGWAYMKMGKYDVALSHFQKSLTVETKEDKPKETDDSSRESAAITFIGIGLIHYLKGDYVNAMLFYQQALELDKKVHGAPSHLTTAQILDNMASVYYAIGDCETALSHHQQSLELTKQVHGRAAHPDIATVLSNIGSVYSNTGDYEKAMLYHQQSLDMEKKVHGNTVHPDIAVSLTNIGIVHNATGDYANALLCHEQSLRMKKRLHGDKCHPGIAASLSNIGLVLSNTGDYDNALVYHQQSLAMEQEVHGDASHPDVATSLTNIGVVYSAKGDYKNALLYHHKALQMNQKVHGYTIHPEIATSLSNIGSVLYKTGDYDNALLLHQQSFDMEKKIYGDTAHPDLAISLNNMGSVHNKKRQYDKALLYYQQSLEMKKMMHGDAADLTVARTLSNIGAAYGKKRLIDHAIFYLMASLNVYEQLYEKAGHPDVSELLCDIAALHCGKRSYNNALLFYQQSITMHQKWHVDAVDSFAAEILAGMGNVYFAMGEYDVALAHHIQAIRTDAMVCN